MIVAVHQHSSNKKAWDRLGILLSGACLIHCIAVVFLPLLIPALALAVHTPWIHRTFALIILVVTPLAFIPGYRRHGLNRILVKAYLGVGFILLGVFSDGLVSEYTSHGFSVIGSLALVLAHLENIRHSRTSRCC